MTTLLLTVGVPVIIFVDNVHQNQPTSLFSNNFIGEKIEKIEKTNTKINENLNWNSKSDILLLNKNQNGKFSSNSRRNPFVESDQNSAQNVSFNRLIGSNEELDVTAQLNEVNELVSLISKNGNLPFLLRRFKISEYTILGPDKKFRIIIILHLVRLISKTKFVFQIELYCNLT